MCRRAKGFRAARLTTFHGNRVDCVFALSVVKTFNHTQLEEAVKKKNKEKKLAPWVSLMFILILKNVLIPAMRFSYEAKVGTVVPEKPLSSA